MTDLLSLSLAELENYIVSIGEPKFRAKQIFGEQRPESADGKAEG